jgi:hypothetical protein
VSESLDSVQREMADRIESLETERQRREDREREFKKLLVALNLWGTLLFAIGTAFSLAAKTFGFVDRPGDSAEIGWAPVWHRAPFRAPRNMRGPPRRNAELARTRTVTTAPVEALPKTKRPSKAAGADQTTRADPAGVYSDPTSSVAPAPRGARGGRCRSSSAAEAGSARFGADPLSR